MRRAIYWQKANRLVYFDEQATPKFWDARWVAEGSPPAVGSRDEVRTVTPEYLAKNARILEGGCGRANKVKAMSDAGFQAIGIDFADETVKQAQINYPDLDIRKGDVRSLEFDDDYFDGYWSIGVIEHFWSGYDSILQEAARVLKPGGVLFLTAPWFSPYRQRKAAAGAFPVEDYTAEEPESFYQFALGRKEVCDALVKHGFQLQSWRGLASEISLKDDVTAFRRQIDWLLNSRGSIVKRGLRRMITTGLNRYCGHSFLAVARRPGTAADS